MIHVQSSPITASKTGDPDPAARMHLCALDVSPATWTVMSVPTCDVVPQEKILRRVLEDVLPDEGIETMADVRPRVDSDTRV